MKIARALLFLAFCLGRLLICLGSCIFRLHRVQPDLLVLGNTLNFHEQEPDAVPGIAPEKEVDTESLSEAAKAILDHLEKLGPFTEPALHVIVGPFPGNATQTGFFVGEAAAPGGTAYGIKTRLFEPALQKLIDKGYLHAPVDGPGTLVFEFNMEAIHPREKT